MSAHRDDLELEDRPSRNPAAARPEPWWTPRHRRDLVDEAEQLLGRKLLPWQRPILEAALVARQAPRVEVSR